MARVGAHAGSPAALLAIAPTLRPSGVSRRMPPSRRATAIVELSGDQLGAPPVGQRGQSGETNVGAPTSTVRTPHIVSKAMLFPSGEYEGAAASVATSARPE